MATRRRNTYNIENNSGGGGGSSLLGILAKLFGGGASPEFVEGTAGISDVSGLEPGSIPVAAKPGYFKSNYNWGDKLTGQPDLAAQYNAANKLNELAGQREVQNNLVQAKMMNQQVVNPQMRYLQLEKSLAGMPQTAQTGLVDAAINNPNIPKINGSSFIPGTTTLDPAVAGAARAEPELPGYAANRMNAAVSNLGTERANSEILGARDVISSRDSAIRAKNLLDESQSNLGLAEQMQNRPNALRTSLFNSQAGMNAAEAGVPLAKNTPVLTQDLLKANIASKQAEAAFMGGPRTTQMKTKEDLDREALLEKQNPALRIQRVREAFANPTPQLTGPITPPAMNTSGPVPQAQALEGTHFITNPDGTILIKIPIVLPNGDILPVGLARPKVR